MAATGTKSVIDYEAAYRSWKQEARHARGKDVILLDLGRSCLSVLCAKVDSDGGLTVLDYAACDNTGYANGVVADPKVFKHCIRRAVKELKSRNSLKIKQLHVTFSAPFVGYYEHFASVTMPPRKRVTLKLIDEVMIAAREEISSLVEHVIQVVPRRYKLDTLYSGAEPPLGMEGRQLGVDMILVTAPKASLDQIEGNLQECGFSVAEWCFAGIAAAESVMAPTGEAGVAVVDVGAANTEVSVYHYGRLLHIGVIESGGSDIDGDLATYLNESMRLAEEIKTNFGCALPQVIHHKEMVDLHERGFAANKIVSLREISTVIRDRAQELLFSVDEEISKAINQDQISRVIFTGGTSKIPGFTDLAEEVLDRCVELGVPSADKGTMMGFMDPRCAALIGMLKIIRKRQLDRGQLEPAAMTGVQRVRSWMGALVGARTAKVGG